jgi:hypothetical protein
VLRVAQGFRSSRSSPLRFPLHPFVPSGRFEAQTRPLPSGLAPGVPLRIPLRQAPFHPSASLSRARPDRSLLEIYLDRRRDANPRRAALTSALLASFQGFRSPLSPCHHARSTPQSARSSRRFKSRIRAALPLGAWLRRSAAFLRYVRRFAPESLHFPSPTLQPKRKSPLSYDSTSRLGRSASTIWLIARNPQLVALSLYRDQQTASPAGRFPIGHPAKQAHFGWLPPLRSLEEP